jgi:hypothetical protein
MVELRNKKNIDNSKQLPKRKYNKKNKNVSKASSPKTSASTIQTSPPDLENSSIEHHSSINRDNNIELLSEKSNSSSQSKNESSTRKDSNQKKARKTRKTYSTFVSTFENAASFDMFLRHKHKFAMMITHGNEVKCTLCDNDDGHKMVAQYRSCQCGYSGCNFSYKCNRCLNSNEWTVHSGGSHSEENEDDSINVRVKGRKPRKRYGIAQGVKAILTDWLEQDDMLTAKKALIRLTNRRKEHSSIHKNNK